MPTLPLFTQLAEGAHPSASRRVMAPGGMEWWHFDAEDETQGLLLVVDVFAGSPFDQHYEKQVQRFLRRPTSVPPPDPRAHAMASIALYRDGICIASLVEHAPTETFTASADTLDVRCPPVRVTAGAETIRVTCEPSDLFDAVALDLQFIPNAPTARQFDIASLGRAGTFINWVCGAPRYAVSGSVRYMDEKGARSVDFSGNGFHESMFGAGLSSRGLAGWARRRVFEDEHTWVCHKFTFAHPEGTEILLSAASMGDAWRSIGAAEWPAFGVVGRHASCETALEIQRSTCAVQRGNSTGRMMVERFGDDYLG